MTAADLHNDCCRLPPTSIILNLINPRVSGWFVDEEDWLIYTWFYSHASTSTSSCNNHKAHLSQEVSRRNDVQLAETMGSVKQLIQSSKRSSSQNSRNTDDTVVWREKFRRLHGLRVGSLFCFCHTWQNVWQGTVSLTSKFYEFKIL